VRGDWHCAKQQRANCSETYSHDSYVYLKRKRAEKSRQNFSPLFELALVLVRFNHVARIQHVITYHFVVAISKRKKGADPDAKKNARIAVDATRIDCESARCRRESSNEKELSRGYQERG
jgi:hypothetical protein